MKKNLLSLSFALLAVVASSVPAFADIVCQPIYGGGQTCVQSDPIVIDKKVGLPNTKGGLATQFVDNLGPTDTKFAPGQVITFQLQITNTGNTTLAKVLVEDILPREVRDIAGPGSINEKVIKFDVLNLNPNETRTVTISGVIVSAQELPAEQSIICTINQAKATENNQTSMDNAQFCIQKVAVGGPVQPTPQSPTTKGGLKVFPPPQVPVTPPTGPEALALVGLIPTGILGNFLRKKAISS